MTDPVTLPAGLAREVFPLAILFDIVDATREETEAEEREGATTGAADHIFRMYPHTLNETLEECDWTGYPALRENGIEPSAVAVLGQGLWLHHTTRSGADYDDVLTLLVPCSCTDGYVSFHLEHEGDLMEVLRGLRRTNGHYWHSSDTSGPHCASIPLRVRN
ncbi:hypothetical protein GCM10010329_80670 [Streptomyces spiroverticillatus]|uniref:Uncharacterized protein n=1 Tax=Streptomyces finlayi TaxID=67296 RepID=A0A919CEQ1_9ACTN|nr:hypothetical protein [Streptomyces finlayi]GHA45936.1 hypothetical protein GCM10010329_80670 [Streptomyces spiroverticillatus]GHD15993.1 hypothetical protein GCM10010334_76590 [Streptomyces finlayi]